MKCDICGSDTDTQHGFILTSSEVVASERYWENKLPKFKHSILDINDFQAKVDFIVGKIAQSALDPSGWLVCEPCSQLFAFDRALARRSAIDGHDRPDCAPADLENAVSAARPVIERLANLKAGSKPQIGTYSTSKYWQCTRCGALHTKDEESRKVNETFLRSGIASSGGETCTGCRTRYDVEDIYAGKFDMRESDDIIAAAIADPQNTRLDTENKTWYHKGRALAGPSMLPTHAEPRWKFWKRSVDR